MASAVESRDAYRFEEHLDFVDWTAVLEADGLCLYFLVVKRRESAPGEPVAWFDVAGARILGDHPGGARFAPMYDARDIGVVNEALGVETNIFTWKQVAHQEEPRRAGFCLTRKEETPSTAEAQAEMSERMPPENASPLPRGCPEETRAAFSMSRLRLRMRLFRERNISWR